MKFASSLLSISLSCGAVACAPDLREDPSGKTAVVESAVKTETGDAGVFETRVVAVSSETWIHFSFATRDEVIVADAATSEAWDLRMSRFNFRVNGGVSGPGHVDAAILPGADFEALVARPLSAEYRTDAPDEDGDGNPDLVFRRAHETSENGWFEYEERFHTVTPADVVYVVRAMDDVAYKVQFLGFYDEYGEGGLVRFRWASLGAAR